jgi:ABC-2 type transport system ATP-binding protein
MPEERGLYKQMTVGEQLLYLGQLKGLTAAQAREQIRFWFKKFDIMAWWDKKVEELSKGMQQKAQFIATVLHRPELLILDEPFSGLDPLNANLIKDEIYELHRNGTSIIFSTHRMEQVEEICHRIVLINKGKNVLEGDVAEVKNRFKQHLFNIGFQGVFPEDTDNLANLATIKAVNGQNMTIQLHDDVKNNDILQFLIQKNVQITEFHEILPSLNEIFIQKVENNS